MCSNSLSILLKVTDFVKCTFCSPYTWYDWNEKSKDSKMAHNGNYLDINQTWTELLEQILMKLRVAKFIICWRPSPDIEVKTLLKAVEIYV